MADSGWTTKATRQKKKNRNRPKSQNTSPNKKRLTRNQRRKRSRQQQKNGGYDATDEKEPENVIDAILKKHPRFKSDKNILTTAIEEMKLKRFDPNDAELNIRLTEKIASIKLSQLGQVLADENEPSNNRFEDDDDQEDGDVEDEEEEDESSYNGKDEDESVDQKESSESMREKTESTSMEEEEEEEDDDDDKKSESPPRKMPQREKKRKRRRNRKKKKKQKSESPQYDDEKSPEPLPPPKATPKKEKKAKKRAKKKKVTLSAKLNSLDFSNCILARHQLNEWVNSLQQTKAFMRSFKRINGLDIIVNKIVMQCGDMDSNIHSEENRLLSESILALFDIMLSGTPKYHQWLFSNLLKLSAQLKEVSSQNSSNERSTLVMVISRQATKFVHAQMRQAQNPNDIAVDRETFQKPSDLLQAGHQKKDPIVPVLSLLDSDCLKLSDMYYDLVVHGIIRDRDCPTASDEFIMTYNEIKNELEQNISLISAKQNSLETELYAMQNKENTLRKQEESELSQYHDTLKRQQAERYRLLDKKRRIEAELNGVNSDLRKTDMFIEGTERDIERIANKFKPEQDRLHDSMQDHQFGIAGYSQELAVYSALLSLGNEAYNMLDNWSHSMNKHDNNQQNDLENNYINQLASYLGKLCSAKMMIRDRVDQLKKYIETLRRTNETTNKHYAQAFVIDDQLEQFRNNITIDEGTSMSITNDIYMNIEKAQKAVSPDLFSKFINHIQHQQTGQLVDLSKYINEINNQYASQNGQQYVNNNVHVPTNRSSPNRSVNMNNQNFVRQRPLRNSRHTRTSIATQTNLQRQQQQQQLRNGHVNVMNQQQQIQQQQQTSVSPTNQQQRASKPPLISSQQQSVNAGVGVAAVRGRPPRSSSHFQTNIRQTRRPPTTRNMYQQSYQQ